MSINDWNMEQVKRAESTWGHKTPQYTKDMFNFIISKGKSWLDLGCGFGRFLEYLLDLRTDPDYIGYDSSSSMIARIRERFPHYKHRVFEKTITSTINHHQSCVLCSAVLIHLTLSDQDKILSNIATINPVAIAFDINSPSEQWLNKGENFERIISPGFRMTWQSHYSFTKKILKLFPKHSLTTKFYKLHNVRHKVVYLLEREDQV